MQDPNFALSVCHVKLLLLYTCILSNQIQNNLRNVALTEYGRKITS